MSDPRPIGVFDSGVGGLTVLREILRRTRIRIETVESVDIAGRTVTTTSPSTHREQILPWDHLVIALGNVVNLARLPGVAQHGLPIKTIGDRESRLQGSFWVITNDTFSHLILPTIALMLISLATYTRYSRASMLEVLNQDYIRTARAKGLTERTVIVRHWTSCSPTATRITRRPRRTTSRSTSSVTAPIAASAASRRTREPCGCATPTRATPSLTTSSAARSGLQTSAAMTP
jgi:hypothetical protein